MSDLRKSIKVIPAVKHRLEGMKTELGLKTESEVILYLQEFYQSYSTKHTLVSHNEIKQRVQDLHRQQSI